MGGLLWIGIILIILGIIAWAIKIVLWVGVVLFILGIIAIIWGAATGRRTV